MPKVKKYLRTAGICTVIAFGCLFGYLMLQNLSAALFINWGLETYQVVDLFPNGFWWSFFVLGVLTPVVEELVFRLLSCRLLKLTKLPDWAVVLISATIFAVYHWSWSQLVYQFLMGIWLAWIYLKTRQIGWTMLIHLINNVFVITYTYFTGTGNDVFVINAGNILLSIGLAVVTTVGVFFLIKKGIPNYEK